MCKKGVYIDFDNIWASILDLVSTFREKKCNNDVVEDVKKEFLRVLDKIINHLDKNNDKIKYIKAFSDFDKLPLHERINIIDILHSKGIQTYIPYVRNNKDMSDRALIISAIKDVAIDRRDIDKIVLLTGDIDYMPLFEFISESTDVNFNILSFKNRLNDGYKEIFYLKNKIKLIDDILKIDSVKLEDEKKYEIFKEFLLTKNLDPIGKELDIKKTISNLNSFYYCKFDEQRIRRYIRRIRDEN